MEFCSLDGGDDGEYYGIGFVEISKMFSMQNSCFYGTQSFDSLYQNGEYKMGLTISVFISHLYLLEMHPEMYIMSVGPVHILP